MSIYEIMMKRKETNLLISTGTNNAIKASKGRAEILSHRITKFWIGNYCWEAGIDFATEASFKNNLRADIVIKDWGIAIEVLGSESVKDFMENKNRYPLPVIPVLAGTTVKDIVAMMDDLAATKGGGWDYYELKYLKELRETKKTLIKSMREVLA